MYSFLLLNMMFLVNTNARSEMNRNLQSMSGMPANSLGVERFVSTSRSSTLCGLIFLNLIKQGDEEGKEPCSLHRINPTWVLEGHESITLPCGAVHVLQLSKLQRGEVKKMELGARRRAPVQSIPQKIKRIPKCLKHLLKVFRYRLFGGSHVHIAHKELSHNLQNIASESLFKTILLLTSSSASLGSARDLLADGAKKPLIWQCGGFVIKDPIYCTGAFNKIS